MICPICGGRLHEDTSRGEYGWYSCDTCDYEFNEFINNKTRRKSNELELEQRQRGENLRHKSTVTISTEEYSDLIDERNKLA
jgi:hypothetical protein